MKEFKRFTNVSIVSNCPKVIVPNKPKIVVFGKDSDDYNKEDYRSIRSHLLSVLPRMVNTEIQYNWMGVRFDMKNLKLIVDCVWQNKMLNLRNIKGYDIPDSAYEAYYHNCDQNNSLVAEVVATRYGFYLFQSGRAGYKFDLGEHGCYSWAFMSNL